MHRVHLKVNIHMRMHSFNLYIKANQCLELGFYHELLIFVCLKIFTCAFTAQSKITPVFF